MIGWVSIVIGLAIILDVLHFQGRANAARHTARKVGHVVHFELGPLQIDTLHRDGVEYMRRWLLGWDWSWGIRVHHILKSDHEVRLHDHPFWFWSFILRGGYYELTRIGADWCGAGTLLYRSPAHRHRLLLEPGQTAWTLVLRGPHVKPWGFGE